jgi:hypothetical protein
MMNRAKGPVWHKKQKEQGIIPEGLRGLDREATWAKSHTDGWVYGHGSFSLTSHKVPILGCFIWMKNSANEAKRMWLEVSQHKGQIKYASMDSKADDYLVTCCRPNMLVSSNRKKMHKFMLRPRCRKIYKERAYKVEPMQGLVKDIFDLDRCWMLGDDNNRWLFAAMGLTIQMHQLKAFHEKKSTWKIKDEVLG